MLRALVLAAVLALLVPAAASAQTIEVRTDPEQPALPDEIPLTVAEGSTDAKLRLFLRTTDDAVEGALLSAQVRAPGGPTADAAFTVPGANAGAPFTIPKAPADIPVDVTVPGPQDGATGPLYVSIKGVFTKLATLKITRPADASDLTVRGVANNKVTVPTETAEIQRTLAIENPGSVPVVNLRLRVTGLTDPRGGSVPLVAKVAGRVVDPTALLTVPANDDLDVALSATGLDLAGPYTGGSVTLLYGKDKRLTLEVEATRTRAEEASVAVTPPDGVHVDTPSISGNSNVVVKVMLTETAGRAVTLGAPQVTVSRETDEDKFDQVMPEPEVNGPGEITVPADGMAEATVTVQDLDGPGAFRVRTQWPGPGEPKLADASVTLRTNWWWLLLVLLPCLALGLLVRWIRVQLRPKLAARQLLALTARRVEDIVAANRPPSADEQRVVDAIRTRLQMAWARRDEGTEIAAERDDIEAKLPILTRWLQAAITTRELADPPAAALQRLQSVGEYLRGSGGDASVQRTELAKVQDEVMRGPALMAAIETLRAAVIEWMAAPHPGGAGDAGKTNEYLAEADKQCRAGEMTGGQTALDSAFRAFLSAAINDLLKLRNPSDLPPGVDATAWSKLGDDLQAAVEAISKEHDPRAALTAYEQGYEAYVKTLLAGLEHALATHTPPVPPAEAKQIREDIAAAYTALTGGSLGTAATLQASAAEKLAAASATATGARSLLRRAVMAPMVEPAVPPTGGPVGSDPAVFALPSTAGRLEGQLLAIDLCLYAFAALVTAALGLTLLWYPNETWGDFIDWFTVALWGLGLQVVGVNAVADVAGVAGRLGGAGPP